MRIPGARHLYPCLALSPDVRCPDGETLGKAAPWSWGNQRSGWELEAAGQQVLLEEGANRASPWCQKCQSSRGPAYQTVNVHVVNGRKSSWKSKFSKIHSHNNVLVSPEEANCVSLPNSTFSDIILVSWNHPWRNHLHQRNWQKLQISALFFWELVYQHKTSPFSFLCPWTQFWTMMNQSPR